MKIEKRKIAVVTDQSAVPAQPDGQELWVAGPEVAWSFDRLAAEAGSWPEVAEDWQWCARFGYQVIERRGTGGGAFRLMYSRFLEEVAS